MPGFSLAVSENSAVQLPATSHSRPQALRFDLNAEPAFETPLRLHLIPKKLSGLKFEIGPFFGAGCAAAARGPFPAANAHRDKHVKARRLTLFLYISVASHKKLMPVFSLA